MHIFTVPSSPYNFTLSPVAGSPSQLSASWSAPIPKNGIITGYSVYCNVSANQSSNVPTIRSVVNGTTLAVTLTGLNLYTQYSCYVTANTSVGQGIPSNILTAQTGKSIVFSRTDTLSIKRQCIYGIFILVRSIFSSPSLRSKSNCMVECC